MMEEFEKALKKSVINCAEQKNKEFKEFIDIAIRDRNYFHDLAEKHEKELQAFRGFVYILLNIDYEKSKDVEKFVFFNAKKFGLIDENGNHTPLLNGISKND